VDVDAGFAMSMPGINLLLLHSFKFCLVQDVEQQIARAPAQKSLNDGNGECMRRKHTCLSFTAATSTTLGGHHDEKI
jgi:hypothetical protein